MKNKMELRSNYPKPGVITQGINCPIIKQNDDLSEIVAQEVLESQFKYYSFPMHEESYYDIDNKDIIGITESVIARAAGMYATVEDIADSVFNIIKNFNRVYTINSDSVLCFTQMIYSRNRFAVMFRGILKGWYKCGGRNVLLNIPSVDEVGNVSKDHPFTNMNYVLYYEQIAKEEGMTVEIKELDEQVFRNDIEQYNWKSNHRKFLIYCGLHDLPKQYYFTPTICLNNICYELNPDFGLLGANRVDDTKVKLFPSKKEAERVCKEVHDKILEKTGKSLIVMAYGDGSYKDLDSGIWEMADPVSSPGYYDPYNLLETTPNEVKVKALADSKELENLSKEELQEAINKKIDELHGTDMKGSIVSQGTTPRRYINFLASLMDLTSGSGDRCTPVVLVKHYFN